MNAKGIIHILENPCGGLAAKWKVRDEAPIEELIAAMHESKTVDMTEILCELLGKRKDPKAVPVLLEALQDIHEAVRSEAAQALAMIESPLAGEPLLKQYLKEEEENEAARVWQVIALGAVQYRPAIPYLIQALQDERLRFYAVLALGELKATEAKKEMQEALDGEKGDYNRREMIKALQMLEK